MKIEEEIVVFCQNIKILRETNGLSKNRMAEILGIGLTSLTKIEQNILPPRIKTDIVFKLSQNFQLKPCELFISILKQPKEFLPKSKEESMYE